MNRNHVTLGLALLLLAACRQSTATPTPAPPPTRTPISGPTSAPAPTPPPSTPGYQALALVIVPEESWVDFAVTFMGSEVSGRLSVKEGTITLIEHEGGTHIVVDMYIDMQSIETGVSILDDLLLTLFNTDDYPTSQFQSEALDALPGYYPRDETVILSLPSQLTLVEEIVDVTVDTVAVLHDRHMEVTATFAVQFVDLGAKPPPLLGDRIAFKATLVTR